MAQTCQARIRAAHAQDRGDGASRPPQRSGGRRTWPVARWPGAQRARRPRSACTSQPRHVQRGHAVPSGSATQLCKAGQAPAGGRSDDIGAAPHTASGSRLRACGRHRSDGGKRVDSQVLRTGVVQGSARAGSNRRALARGPHPRAAPLPNRARGAPAPRRTKALSHSRRPAARLAALCSARKRSMNAASISPITPPTRRSIAQPPPTQQRQRGHCRASPAASILRRRPTPGSCGHG